MTALASGCTTAGLMFSAVGVATDTSVPWAVTKHIYGQFTEGDPAPCFKLNGVQRALSARCGAFEVGSIKPEDLANHGLQECPLTLATQEPQFWPVLPELVAKGARPESCYRSPLVALAQTGRCPEFSSASQDQIRALTWLAHSDPRAIHHDVVRLLSCPEARRANLDSVLGLWWREGRLSVGQVGFGVLGALHPDHLDSPLARQLEAHGHTARAAVNGQDRKLPSGFEEALRLSHLQALSWWLEREPGWVDRVPAVSGAQLDWVPLARVLTPTFLADPERQSDMVRFLLSQGANPNQRLPFNQSLTVLRYAQEVKSPFVEQLERASEIGLNPRRKKEPSQRQ